jgi:hypothetical protein
MKMNNIPEEIKNTQDVIDSRDIIERIEYLEGLESSNEIEDYELEELNSLKKFAEEGKDNAEDWEYGAFFIRDGYFTEYAQELCEDIGELPKDLPSYISCHIDWDGVADDLKVDYNYVDFGDETYWVR